MNPKLILILGIVLLIGCSSYEDCKVDCLREKLKCERGWEAYENCKLDGKQISNDYAQDYCYNECKPQ